MISQKIFGPGPIGNLLAIFAGASLTLSFAPMSWFPLAIFSPAILLVLWIYLIPTQAFTRGWLYGLGFFGTSVYWVYNSIHIYGEAPFWLAGIITGLFVIILGIFIAVQGFLLNYFFPLNKSTKYIFCFPAIWVFLEWIRSWIFTGFPWVLLGYSQIHSPLKGFAPIFGVFGVSLACALTSGLLVNSIYKIYHRKILHLAMSLLAIIILWTIGGYLSFIQWTKPYGKPVKVSLIQGNIPQELKWSPEQVKPTIDKYINLSQQHLDSKIIIWPEAAIPLPFFEATPYLGEIDKIAKANSTTIITGIPVRVPNTPQYLNSIIVLGQGKGIYNKQKLVPFGEFTPFPKVMTKVMDLMNIPMSSFIPGNGTPTPLTVDDIQIAPYICYEIAYPEQALSSNDKVNILLTVSNDAWFGQSIALPQHLEMGQMRSLETGRPLLFVSNTGITAIVNPDGTLKVGAPPFETFVLTDMIQPMQGKTPWQNATMDRVLYILLLMILIARGNLRRKKV